MRVLVPHIARDIADNLIRHIGAGSFRAGRAYGAGVGVSGLRVPGSRPGTSLVRWRLFAAAWVREGRAMSNGGAGVGRREGRTIALSGRRDETPRYEPVPLPTGSAYPAAPAVIAGVRRWVTAPPMRDLVAAFGGTLPDLATGELLDWLDNFSAECWDFRARSGGAERDAVTAPVFPERTAALVHHAATALGLVQPVRPPADRYQYLLILGGLARSCLDRTGYAAALVTGAVGDAASAAPVVAAPTVEVGQVAALGSYRPLREVETGQLRLPPECRYEIDVMDFGVRSAFGLAGPDEVRSSTGEVDHRSWSVRTYRPADKPLVRVLAAPSTEPATRRAHTTDTYHFFAAQVRLSPADRVLIVTCPIYVPFQHCDAIRTLGLGYGCAVHTIGVDPARLPASGLPARTWTTDRYLQEIRSAIRSMRHLHASISVSARR